MTAETARIAASALIEDFDLYPRRAVDNSHVADLARALEAGGELPAIIADRATNRIVDGFHRRKAYIRAFGSRARVPVQFRDYESEASLLKEAVALNAAHGRRLDLQDQARSARLLDKAGVPAPEIAIILRTTQERVSTLFAKVVLIRDDPEREDDLERESAKKPVAGNARPSGRYQPAPSAPEYWTGQTVDRLALRLRSGLVDMTEPGLREKLAGLAVAIKEALN